MQALILCPAPSLPQRIHTSADLIIGVNRAAILHDCDAWAAGDAFRIFESGPDVIGSPLLLTTSQAAATPWRGERTTFEALFDWLHPGTSLTAWSRFTMTAAIVYAAHEGAAQIDILGCDWKGDEDFDGVKSGASRDESRWEQERAIFVKVQTELATRGITVNRNVHQL